MHLDKEKAYSISIQEALKLIPSAEGEPDRRKFIYELLPTPYQTCRTLYYHLLSDYLYLIHTLFITPIPW